VIEPNRGVLKKRLDSTVRLLCSLIDKKLRAAASSPMSEYQLRRELVGCLLGSGVRYEMSVAATENLDAAGLLSDSWWTGKERKRFEQKVFDVLDGRNLGVPHKGRYRFPATRANQISGARDALSRMPLSAHLSSGREVRALRKDLLETLPGIGPKQASMFLRNTGISYDLAILDTHVVRFMEMRHPRFAQVFRLSTIRAYEHAETVVCSYAFDIGYPAGYLDWAIWATMKAAHEHRI
jgi:N-glycosylase/DNA lyase